MTHTVLVKMRNLRVGDRFDGYRITSKPIPSAMGPGFVSFSFDCDAGVGIAKQDGEKVVEVRRRD